MKSCFLLLFIVLVATKQVEASNNHRLRASARQLLDEAKEEKEGRFFIRYRNRRGRRLAKKCAQTVIQDNNDDDGGSGSGIFIFQGSSLCTEQLASDIDILEADYDHPLQALGSKNDDRERDSLNIDLDVDVDVDISPWGIEMIQANQVEQGEDDIVICIVDSGIAIDHPYFNNTRITGDDSMHFFGPLKWNEDVYGHGTRVAGIIAAMAPNARLHITRGLRDDGSGFESDMRFAVEQCVAAGAKVINMSIGGPSQSPISEAFFTQIVEEYGVLLVAASGNDGISNLVYPASHPSVLSVTAVDHAGVRWSGSNYGEQIEFAAPGKAIVSPSVTIRPNDGQPVYSYGAVSGTSYATPHVAAAAALVWSQREECSHHHIRYVLALTADNSEDFCDDQYGYGIVKAKDASDWFLDGGECTSWPAPAPSQGGCTTIQ